MMKIRACFEREASGIRILTLRSKIKHCPLFLALIMALILGSLLTALAKEGGQALPTERTTEGKKELKLDLKEAIRLSLVNNLDIAAERFNPQIAETTIASARSAFHPSVFTGIDGERSVKPSASATFRDVVFNSNLNFNAGLRSKLLTGGNVELRYNSNRSRTNSATSLLTPTIGTDLALTLRQPLLKDYGIYINKSDIRISENQKEISVYGLASKVNDIVAQTEIAYWELVSAIEILKVRERSLALAEDLLRKNKIQVEVGVLAPVEVLAAEAVVASRKETLINARMAIRDSADRLRKIMNLKDEKDVWEIDIIPTDKPPFQELRPSAEEELKKALDQRYDYKQAKKDLENRGIRVKVAKNSMLPRVDLVGSFGLNGLSGETTSLWTTNFGGESPLEGNYADSVHELFSGDFYAWKVGVSVEYPLGNVGRRSEYTKRKLEEQQAITKLQSLELGIQEEVRKAVRRLQGDVERVKATRVARELAKARLEAEEKKLDVGISTNFEVLELQEDLAIVENNEVSAIIDYNQSVVELQRVTATLLDNRNIKIE